MEKQKQKKTFWRKKCLISTTCTEIYTEKIEVKLYLNDKLDDDQPLMYRESTSNVFNIRRQTGNY